MAKIKARNLQRSSLFDVNGKPFRLAWLIPKSDAAERTTTERVIGDGGKAQKSILARLRETESGFEGYAVKSKTPLVRREWLATEWRVMETEAAVQNAVSPTPAPIPALVPGSEPSVRPSEIPEAAQ